MFFYEKWRAFVVLDQWILGWSERYKWFPCSTVLDTFLNALAALKLLELTTHAVTSSSRRQEAYREVVSNCTVLDTFLHAQAIQKLLELTSQTCHFERSREMRSQQNLSFMPANNLVSLRP